MLHDNFFLLLVCESEAHEGQRVAARLMEQGHTVFLSDQDADIEFIGDVVDAVVEVQKTDADEPRVVLYDLVDKANPRRAALRERAAIRWPASDDDLASLTGALAPAQEAVL